MASDPQTPPGARGAAPDKPPHRTNPAPDKPRTGQTPAPRRPLSPGLPWTPFGVKDNHALGDPRSMVMASAVTANVHRVARSLLPARIVDGDPANVGGDRTSEGICTGGVGAWIRSPGRQLGGRYPLLAGGPLTVGTWLASRTAPTASTVRATPRTCACAKPRTWAGACCGAVYLGQVLLAELSAGHMQGDFHRDLPPAPGTRVPGLGRDAEPDPRHAADGAERCDPPRADH